MLSGQPGRRQGKDAKITSVMAPRPDPAEFDRPLTTEDLAKRRHNLSMLSERSVRHAYRLAWERCKMQADGLPRASSAVPELVTAWKLLWSWRRHRRDDALR
jgi:hypothetical protein